MAEVGARRDRWRSGGAGIQAPGRLVGRFLLGAFVWVCFVKLPATAGRDDPAQSWETVLSFAAAHHLQWGPDVIFTYGPLGFLNSDHYWGSFFWPTLIWSFGFALLMTEVFLSFSERLSLPVRVATYVALPLMAVAPSGSLGFEAVHLLAFVVVGLAACPEERPGVTRLIVSGLALAILSLIKFTFCVLFFWTLLVVVVAHVVRGRSRMGAGILVGGGAAFLGAWLLAGQRLAHLPVYFRRSAQIASGYSSAMALPAEGGDLLAGLLLLACLIGLLSGYCRACGAWRPQAARVCLVGAGIFVAWKEGFTRADHHVIVFLTFAFLIAALMPGLLRAPRPAQRSFLPLTAATLAVSLTALAFLHPAYLAAAVGGLRPRLSDTVTALFAPTAFKGSVERLLASLGAAAALPRIRAAAGDGSVGVLSTDQHVAILNGLNYRPHPVFHSYSAHTAELLRLNAAAFDASRAPDFVLWRYASIDSRFPTLDEGEVILKVLDGYTPIVSERGFLLWKRNPARGPGYSLLAPTEVSVAMGQELRGAGQPTWLVIELRETWLGAAAKLLYHAAPVYLDVQARNGQGRRFRLPPGNAAAGFLADPLLLSEGDLARPFLRQPGQKPLAAFRLSTDSPWAYDRSIRFVVRRIEGLPAVQTQPKAD